MQYYSRRVKFIHTNSDHADDFQVHPSTYNRIAQLQTSALFPSLRRLECYFGVSTSSYIFLCPSPLLDSLQLYHFSGFEDSVVGPFLTTLSSFPQMLTRIVLCDGRISVDILKKSLVHFKQLRSLELSDVVFMADFSLWEVLGTLPFLENLTLVANNPASHPAHAPENSNSQSGGLRSFDALESLQVTGSFFLIQHLLGFIDSPCLKSIQLYPRINRVHNDSELEHEAEDLTPSMTIVASKWSQSLKILTIASNDITHRNSKFLMPLADLHEMQTLILMGWRMEKNNDALRRLSWPKLKHLGLFPWPNALSPNRTSISLSNLRIIAENCPELRNLDIDLDLDTIPPFDDIFSKSLCHNLEVLNVRGVHQSITQWQISLERQIQVARHLDLIFPCVKNIYVGDVNWLGIRDLVKLCQDARRGQ